MKSTASALSLTREKSLVLTRGGRRHEGAEIGGIRLGSTGFGPDHVKVEKGIGGGERGSLDGNIGIEVIRQRVEDMMGMGGLIEGRDMVMVGGWGWVVQEGGDGFGA